MRQRPARCGYAIWTCGRAALRSHYRVRRPGQSCPPASQPDRRAHLTLTLLPAPGTPGPVTLRSGVGSLAANTTAVVYWVTGPGPGVSHPTLVRRVPARPPDPTGPGTCTVGPWSASVAAQPFTGLVALRSERSRKWTAERSARGPGLVNHGMTCGNAVSTQVRGMIDDRGKPLSGQKNRPFVGAETDSLVGSV
jgi:hypothetical protein